MRWLIISAQHHPSHGGIGTYVMRFVSAATRAGWHVELITRPSASLPPATKVHLITTADRQAAFESRVAALRRLERIRPYRYALWSKSVADFLVQWGGDCDAIEFVDCQAEGYAALGSKNVRKRFSATPLIVHAHTPMFVEEELNGADMQRFGRQIYHNWERAAIRSADGVITTSEGLLRRLPPNQAAAVIPYPIEPENGDGKLNNVGQNCILAVGSVQPRKGVDTWARSLNIVFEKCPHIVAKLVGADTPTGPGGGSMAEYIRTLVEPRFAHRFQLLGALDHRQVIALIKSSSLIVVPSVFESFSFAAAEGLLCGRPVIVSTAVGIGEHVQRLPSFCPRNVSQLASMQLEVMHDLPAAESVACQCRRQLLEKCSAARHLDLKAKFAQQLQVGLASGRTAWTTSDAHDELGRFLASVEDEECGANVASGHGS